MPKTRRSSPSSSTARPTSGSWPRPASRRRRANCPTTSCRSNIPSRPPPPIQQRLMDDLVAAGVDGDHGLARSIRRPRPTALNKIGGQIAAVHHRQRRAADQPHRLYRLVQHRRRQAGRRDRHEGDARRRQVHGLRRPARRRQRQGAHRGHRRRVEGTKIELVDVRGDDIDQTRAKRNVEDVLAANPDINCMVGFYSYNTPRSMRR